jgi:hypothetical protein
MQMKMLKLRHANPIIHPMFYDFSTIPAAQWCPRRDDVVKAMDGGMTLLGRSFTVDDDQDHRVVFLSGKDIDRYCDLTFWDQTQMRIHPYFTRPKAYIGVTLVPSSRFEASIYHSVGINILAVALRDAGFKQNPLFVGTPSG